MVCHSKPIAEYTYEECMLLRSEIDERCFQLGKGAYSSGKIYRIVQIDHFVLVYVGSTIHILDHRFNGHRSFIAHCPLSKLSQYIYANGGPENFRIELIMDYPCRSKQELEYKEGYFVYWTKPLCNTNIPGNYADKIQKPPSLETLLSSAERDYEQIADVDEQMATDIFCRKSKKLADVGDILKLQKFWFDSRISTPGLAVERKRVFSNLIDQDKLKLFENIYAEKRAQVQPEGPDLQYLNPHDVLSRGATQRHNLVVAIRDLCGLLQITSSHDTSAKVYQNMLLDNKTELLRVVDNILNMMPGVKSRSVSSDELKRLQMKINNIFSAFSGSSFQQSRFGKGNQKIAYVVKVQDTLVRDIVSLVDPEHIW